MATANFTTKPPMQWMKPGSVVRFLRSALPRHVWYYRGIVWYFYRPSQTEADVFSMARSWWLCKEGDVLSWAKRCMQGNLYSSNLLEDGVSLISPARVSCPPMPTNAGSYVETESPVTRRGWTRLRRELGPKA
jgi:hypothetical protein